MLLRGGRQPAQALSEHGVVLVLDTLEVFGKKRFGELVSTHAPVASSLGQAHTASVDADMLRQVLVS